MIYEPIQYIDMFLEERDINDLSRYQYRFNLKRFFNWAQNKGLDYKELTRGDVIAYKHELQKEGKTNLTVVNYLMSVRLFYKWMNENNYYDDITTSLRIKKEYKTFLKKSLTAEQAATFLQTFECKTIIDKRDYAIANLMLRNGLREIEVTRMNVGDIIDHNKTRAIRIQRKGKSEKNSILPLSEKAMDAIETYLLARTDNWDEEDPLFVSFNSKKIFKRLKSNWISQMIKSKLKSSGFNDPQITAHSLRHTTATLLIADGLSEYDVQNIMGHSSFSITQIYTKQKENDLMFVRNAPKRMDRMF